MPAWLVCYYKDVSFYLSANEHRFLDDNLYEKKKTQAPHTSGDMYDFNSTEHLTVYGTTQMPPELYLSAVPSSKTQVISVVLKSRQTEKQSF